MASVTIDDLDEAVLRRLQRSADAHGRSLDAELRAILVTGADRAEADRAYETQETRAEPPVDASGNISESVATKSAAPDGRRGPDWIVWTEDGPRTPGGGRVVFMSDLPQRPPEEAAAIRRKLERYRFANLDAGFDQKAFTDDLWSFVE